MGGRSVRVLIIIVVWVLAWGCDRKESGPSAGGPKTPTARSASVEGPRIQLTLAAARKAHVTKLTKSEHEDDPVDVPPKGLFDVVEYKSPAGTLAAYVRVPKRGSAKSPAIVWISGGFSNSIGEWVWERAKPDNDQTASAFWRAGIVTMFPSLRGGNKNPGVKEGFYGEVDDVLAAADWLAKQPNVDPHRLYLGGHSTGGTLVMLATEVDEAQRFRATFAFGPVANVANYGQADLPFDVSNDQEVQVRMPLGYMNTIRTPLFVLEGADRGNITDLRLMARLAQNPLLHFHPVDRANHFSILAPATAMIAKKILADTGDAASIAFSDEEIARLRTR